MALLLGRPTGETIDPTRLAGFLWIMHDLIKLREKNNATLGE
jgi:hypothetical protein